MSQKIIFFAAISIAVLAVILLAVLSPVTHRKPPNKNPNPPWLALSLYIQQPFIPNSINNPIPQLNSGAFIFRRTLTEGPENTSRIVGKAQGFIIPAENFAHSAFNIIYITFDTPEHSGSLSVQVKHVTGKNGEELTVVGGTGSFAFARGVAVIAETDKGSSENDSIYHVKLQLRFPDKAPAIPGSN